MEYKHLSQHTTNSTQHLPPSTPPLFTIQPSRSLPSFNQHRRHQYCSQISYPRYKAMNPGSVIDFVCYLKYLNFLKILHSRYLAVIRTLTSVFSDPGRRASSNFHRAEVACTNAYYLVVKSGSERRAGGSALHALFDSDSPLV